MERDWEGELDEYLHDRFGELCATMGQPVPFSGLRINPPLGVEESEYFLSGLEAGLFQPDELGYVQSELMPRPKPEDARQTICPLFWNEASPPRLLRERVCQLSTASSLILKRGWLRHQVLLEPDIIEYQSVAHGVDLLVRSSQEEIIICVEVKRSLAELEKLITDLRACGKRGRHGREECGFPQNHPKYEFCTLAKPTYFWAVAPGADICLRMAYDQGLIGLEQLEALPPRSLIEAN